MDQAEEAMDQLDGRTVRECARVVIGLDSENSDALAFLSSVEQVLRDEPGKQAELQLLAPTPIRDLNQPTSFANGRYSGEEAPRRGW